MAEWISCKEELPEKGVVVLTAIYGTDYIVQEEGESFEEAIERNFKGPGHVTISFLDDDGFWCDGYFGGPEIISPTYWMYFPEPPMNPRFEV